MSNPFKGIIVPPIQCKQVAMKAEMQAIFFCGS
jgi:hypothetical protein